MKPGENIKMYVCCPHDSCDSYKDAISFLLKHGVEPNIGQDDTGHYFEIIIPDDITFQEELNKRIATQSDSGINETLLMDTLIKNFNTDLGTDYEYEDIDQDLDLMRSWAMFLYIQFKNQLMK
jgi:hypothetical protein